jgi:hypothetical protein
MPRTHARTRAYTNIRIRSMRGLTLVRPFRTPSRSFRSILQWYLVYKIFDHTRSAWPLSGPLPCVLRTVYLLVPASCSALAVSHL